MTRIEATHSKSPEAQAAVRVADAASPRAAAAWLGTLWMALGAVAGEVPAWIDRARQRRELMALDERMLRDIGLTRLDAWREWRKPFWRP